MARDALERWLPDAGVAYRWEERLGGRRSLPESSKDDDPWWQVAQFRAYAAHTRTTDFVAALDELLAETAQPTAVMCSESVWWRCHRRLIADVCVVGRGIDVQHLMPDGRLRPHRPADGARRRGDGLIVWDDT